MDDRITVLQVCEHFGGKEASLHGVARAFQWWIPSFDKNQFRVILCSRKGRDKAAEQMEEVGVSPIYLGYGKMDPRNLLSLLKLIREEDVDIIHAHGYGACTWGRLAGRMKGIPVIVHERCNTHVVPWYQRPVEWILSGATTHCLAVSESSRQFCIKKRFMKPEIVQVLYHGILMDDIEKRDEQWVHDLRAERCVPDDHKIIGIVGRLESHKGHIDAFKALHLVLKDCEKVKMWILGDGAYADILKHWVSENGLSGHVDFLGFRRDARDVIQCFDVQLFPSHMEGTPNTLYEAMAVGNPAVASTADGQGEILEDGKTALLFDPGDHDAMAKKLVRVLSDDELRRSLADASAKLAGEFDGRKAIEKMQDLYRSLTC